MKKSLLSLVLISVFGLVFSGCTIKREVKPIQNMTDTNICIIKNDKVKGHFLESYVDTLEELGYIVNVLPPYSQKDSCKIVSTYTARKSWSITTYMSYARIKVYEDSKLIGKAVYDARDGKGKVFDVHINAHEMTESLVEDLFKKQY
ncbi:MAG: Sbal_3080 family lipoprotein [Campylobacterota bacterium]|nr:Sbal_3080 family lipoprotein [Campylobacterota bacterium]